MRKWIVSVMLVLAAVFSGCSAEVFEPMLDVYNSGEQGTPLKMQIELPDDAAFCVMSGDTGTLYYGEHYEVSVETYPSGNISQTLYNVTGHKMEELTVMEIPVAQGNSYRCGWSAANDEGEQIGQCIIIDDGRFHYCLSVLADAEEADALRPVIRTVLNSYSFPSY